MNWIEVWKFVKGQPFMIAFIEDVVEVVRHRFWEAGAGITEEIINSSTPEQRSTLLLLLENYQLAQKESAEEAAVSIAQIGEMCGKWTQIIILSALQEWTK